MKTITLCLAGRESESMSLEMVLLTTAVTLTAQSKKKMKSPLLKKLWSLATVASLYQNLKVSRKNTNQKKIRSLRKKKILTLTMALYLLFL